MNGSSKGVAVNVLLNEDIVYLIDTYFPTASRSFTIRYILIDYFIKNGLYELKDDFLYNSRS